MGIIGSFDQTVLDLVHKLPASMRWLMLIVTNVGSPPACIIVLLAAAVWAYRHKNKHLAAAEIALIISMPLSSLIKELTRRVRPDTLYVQHMLFRSYSFPSSHAYASMLTFGFLAYIAWYRLRSARKWLAVCGLVLAVVLVGLSRLYLGAHYPSDVLGGWILAAIVLLIVIKFSPKPNQL